MKQFLTVFRFEFKNYAKNKVFIAITLLAILLLGGVLFFPRLKEAFSSDTQVEEPGQAKEIIAAAGWMNNYPRKVLGGTTAARAFDNFLAEIS